MKGLRWAFGAPLLWACSSDGGAATSGTTGDAGDASGNPTSEATAEPTSSSGPSSITNPSESSSAPTSAAESSSGGGDDQPPPISFDVATPELDLPYMPPPLCPCAENTDRIHVNTTDGALYAFDPPTLEFELVANVLALPGCSTPQFFSMSLDRDGLAWLQFSDGTLHTLDINEPVGCTDVGFVPPPALGITNFGMGFVSESLDNPCDTLFGHRIGFFGGDGPGVGLLFEVDTEAVDVVASYPTDFNRAELTGTGDGRLFAFVDSIPAQLVEFDKTSGAALEQIPLVGVDASSAFAFAAYGGDFYFFTGSDSDFSRSEVNHIDHDDSDDDGVQQITEVVPEVPFVGLISGAGVSTCAPSEPPPA